AHLATARVMPPPSRRLPGRGQQSLLTRLVACTKKPPMRLLCLVALALAACSDSAQSEGPASPPDAALPDATLPDARADAATALVIPDPGTGPMPQVWPVTEPNDTPEQAVALGVGLGQIGPYVGLFGAGGHIGGGDEADWFVFRTGHDPGTTFIATACWDPALHVNLLDFALYQFFEGQPL